MSSIGEEARKLREKAIKLAEKSPNLQEMISVKVDSKTTIYFRKGTSEEKIKERLKAYANRKFDYSGE